MTANLLTLNSSKIEFLPIGLKQQLAKISSFSLDTAHSARNFGFIFDEHISFSDQISALSKSCYSHIGLLRCIRPYLWYLSGPEVFFKTCVAMKFVDDDDDDDISITKLPVPLPPPSCTPSLTTATRSTYNLPNTQTVFRISKIKFFLSAHTKSSLPLNLRIYIILSLFSPIVALVHRIS